MELFLMTLVTGIMVGGIYALIALGWVVIYKCSGVLNLAMGELTLIGAYVSWWLYSTGVPFVVCVFLTILAGIILGIVTERIFLDRLIGQPLLSVIMVTVGLSFFFRGTAMFIWGPSTKAFHPPVFAQEPIQVGMVSLTPVFFWSFVVVIALLIALVAFFKYTRWGLSMQATADDETAALSLGVSVRFVYAASWSIAFITAGIGGALLANINGLNINIAHLGLVVLPAVIFGGLNSIPGAIVGGIVIGILENMTGTYLTQLVPGGIKTIVPFIFLVVFMMFRPYGLWGWERIERV
jgi:branched-chain amino acid transport system permease protein